MTPTNRLNPQSEACATLKGNREGCDTGGITTVDYLTFKEKPQLEQPNLLVAFIGWADAQEGASRAIRYLAKNLPAKSFATIDPEEFYDFTLTRPTAFNNNEKQRILRWPSNEFFYWRNPVTSKDLILFLGTEPNLKWRTYTQALLSVIRPYNVQEVIGLGSLLDALPHTRETRLSGGANNDALKAKLTGIRIMESNYQGPVGITSAFVDACTKEGMDYLSLWGHAPHYVQRTPNFKVTAALVAQVKDLLTIDIKLEELEQRGRDFEAEVTKAISASVEVSSYVKRLERQYDVADGSGAQDLPPPETVIEDVEEFLRRDRPGDGSQFPGG